MYQTGQAPLITYPSPTISTIRIFFFLLLFYLTPDTWHLTFDTWHLTCDTWWGVNILSKFQLPNSSGLGSIVSWMEGGMPGCSVDHYIIKMIQFIHSSMDGNHDAALLAIPVDYSKAFDRMLHSDILCNLSQVSLNRTSQDEPCVFYIREQNHHSKAAREGAHKVTF